MLDRKQFLIYVFPGGRWSIAVPINSKMSEIVECFEVACRENEIEPLDDRQRALIRSGACHSYPIDAFVPRA